MPFVVTLPFIVKPIKIRLYNKEARLGGIIDIMILRTCIVYNISSP